MKIHPNDDGTTEFAYFRRGAQCVNLAGDFNDWDPTSHPMTRDSGGWWRVRLALPPGEYRFKYCVDGQEWEADTAGYALENDGQGGWNSVVWVRKAGEPLHFSAAA